MAFRGGVPMHQAGKRHGGGFDNQFEDLTMNPTPPKRARTSGSFKAPNQSKTPLKFKFQKAPLAMHNPIAPKQDLPAASSRFVSKPVLVSQTAAPPPARASTQDDPWGDDKDEDDQFLLAASQAVEEKVINKPSEEELAALTMACADEDDFDMDDIDGGDACDRLNQTVAVFTQVESVKVNNKPFDNSFAENVFKPPLPKPALGVAANQKEAEINKLKRDLEALRKEKQKAKDDSLRAKGEVSYLRTELTKKASETEAERCSRIQMEKKVRMELETAEKNRKAALAAVETEKAFMLQEMEGLRDRLRKMEDGGRGDRKSMLGKEIRVKEESGKTDSFPNAMDFEVRKVETKESETQTEKVLRRRTKLAVTRPTLNLDVLNLTRLCNVSDGIKAAILQTTTDNGKHREINKVVKSTLVDVEKSLNNAKANVAPQVSVLSHVVALAPSGVTLAERRPLVTACVAMVLQGGDTAVLGLRLLTVAWDVARLTVVEAGEVLAALGNMLSPLDKRKLSPTLVRVVLEVVRIMSRDMADLLCVRDKEKCFLSSISSLLHATAMGDVSSRWEAARGATRWMAEGLAQEGGRRRPWMDNSCRWCTGDMVRSMVLVTSSLVTDYTALEGSGGREDGLVKETSKHYGRDVNESVNLREENDVDVKDKMGSVATTRAIGKGEVVAVLKDCVTCLAGMQDKLRVANDVEESDWVRLLEVTCSVQRRYIWTIDQLHRILDGEQSLVRRLDNLTMETKDDES